jgi:hypothetical protein
MEKNIKLTMGADKTIKIVINDEEKHTILENARSISADEIYKIIGFSIGDHYIVSFENIANVDEPVLKYFYELFNEIIIKINSLNNNTEDIDFEDDTKPEPSDWVDDIPF